MSINEVKNQNRNQEYFPKIRSEIEDKKESLSSREENAERLTGSRSG
jgi:hypothetical protein